MVTIGILGRGTADKEPEASERPGLVLEVVSATAGGAVKQHAVAKIVGLELHLWITTVCVTVLLGGRELPEVALFGIGLNIPPAEAALYVMWNEVRRRK
jgi:hypothetical protein